jgi:hypothetical protein
MKQRTDSFNFFIVIEALLGNIIAGLMIASKSETIPFLFLTILLFIILPLLFWGLDNRTLLFIKRAKNEMKLIEKEMKIIFSYQLCLIFEVDESARNIEKHPRRFIQIKMTTVFLLTYLSFSAVGLTTLIFVLLSAF